MAESLNETSSSGKKFNHFKAYSVNLSFNVKKKK